MRFTPLCLIFKNKYLRISMHRHKWIFFIAFFIFSSRLIFQMILLPILSLHQFFERIFMSELQKLSLEVANITKSPKNSSCYLKRKKNYICSLLTKMNLKNLLFLNQKNLSYVSRKWIWVFREFVNYKYTLTKNDLWKTVSL